MLYPNIAPISNHRLPNPASNVDNSVCFFSQKQTKITYNDVIEAYDDVMLWSENLKGILFGFCKLLPFP